MKNEILLIPEFCCCTTEITANFFKEFHLRKDLQEKILLNKLKKKIKEMNYNRHIFTGYASFGSNDEKNVMIET